MKTQTKNKKAQQDSIIRILLWIVFIIILFGVVYFIAKNLFKLG